MTWQRPALFSQRFRRRGRSREHLRDIGAGICQAAPFPTGIRMRTGTVPWGQESLEGEEDALEKQQTNEL